MASLIPSWCCIRSSNNLLLQQSFCLSSRCSIASLWSLSTKLSWSSSTFWVLPGYQSNSWWEIPSLPLDDCAIIENILAFPQHKLIHAMDATCDPARIMFYHEVLPSFMSRILLEFHHLLRILDIVILLAISIHILVPVLFLTGIRAI